MSHWTYIDEKVPQIGGEYLVVVKLGGKLGNYTFMSYWDKQRNQFSYDLLMREKGDPTRVHAWLDIPPAPLHKSSLLDKQEKQL